MSVTNCTVLIPTDFQMPKDPTHLSRIEHVVVADCNGKFQELEKGTKVSLAFFHLYDRGSFSDYIERGGRNCMLCRNKIEWYAEFPNLVESLGEKEVSWQLNKVKLEGEHRVEHHQERATLEEEVVKSFFLIEYAATSTSHNEMPPFIEICNQKDTDNTRTIIARIREESVTPRRLAALQKHPALLQKLYESFMQISKYDTIQDFVNALFKQDTNFFLYNSLLREANIDMFHECAQLIIGGEGVERESDGEKVIADAEWGKKFRGAMGLLFVGALMIGIGRKIFRLT